MALLIANEYPLVMVLSPIKVFVGLLAGVQKYMKFVQQY